MLEDHVAHIISGKVHDLWFDVDSINTSIQKPIELQIPLRMVSSGPDVCRLVIPQVTRVEIEDTERIGVYDINRIHIDIINNQVVIIGNIPIRVLVTTSQPMSVHVEYT